MRIQFRIEGRVQGVGFRWWTRDEARALDLAGFVRNEPDGAVSGEAEGDDAALERFKALLQEGPPSARVMKVEWALDGSPASGRQSLPHPFDIHR